MMRFVWSCTYAKGFWIGCVIGGGVLAMPSAGWAKEITFTARDVQDQQAVWLPREIVIHRSVDFTEPLIFRFSNPTARTHVFEAPGLFESAEEGGVQSAKSVRVTIAPEETEHIVINRNQIMRDANGAEGEVVRYRFYCPLHRSDDDMGGTITVGQ